MSPNPMQATEYFNFYFKKLIFAEKTARFHEKYNFLKSAFFIAQNTYEWKGFQ